MFFLFFCGILECAEDGNTGITFRVGCSVIGAWPGVIIVYRLDHWGLKRLWKEQDLARDVMLIDYDSGVWTKREEERGGIMMVGRETESITLMPADVYIDQERRSLDLLDKIL